MTKELEEKWKKLALDISYFNAAEGDMWFKETQARNKVQAEFKKVSEQLGHEKVKKLRKEGDYLL